MLTRVEVVTGLGTQLILPVGEVSSGYTIQDIEGLDPVKANVVTTSFAMLDGAQYHTSRREPRNIVLKLGMEVGGTPVSQLRSRLYTFFMTKTSVKLRFFSDDMEPVDIVGRVESFESQLFTQEPTASISLLCERPDFRSTNLMRVFGSTTPTADNILVNYQGTVETGFLLRMVMSRELRDFTIYQSTPNGEIQSLDYSNTILSGDTLLLSTVAGDKYATRVRSNNETSVLYGVSPYSAWLNLYPGQNEIRVQAKGAAIPYTLEYTTKYGGL